MSQSVRTQPPVSIGGKTINALADNVYAEALQMILDLVELDQVNRDYPREFRDSLPIPHVVLELINGRSI